MLMVIFPVRSIAADDEASLMPMELDGTQWVIEITPVNKKSVKNTEKDTLIFKDKKFTSKAYNKKGYALTSYSLSVSEEGTTSFGTMQIKDKETSFWKGEVNGKKIDGLIHIQHPSGENIAYEYKGMLSKGELKRKDKKKPVMSKAGVILPEAKE